MDLQNLRNYHFIVSIIDDVIRLFFTFIIFKLVVYSLHHLFTAKIVTAIRALCAPPTGRRSPQPCQPLYQPGPQRVLLPPLLHRGLRIFGPLIKDPENSRMNHRVDPAKQFLFVED